MNTETGEGFKAIADFWTAQGNAMGKAVLDAQQGAARTMVEGMQAMFGGGTAPPDLTQAGEAVRQLWTMATQLSTELAGRLGQPAGGSTATTDMLERLTNPRQWMLGNGEIDEALARMVDGPRLADLWDVERRYGSVMRRWTELRQCSAEHQRVVLGAWMAAAQQYLAETAARSGADGTAFESKQALALWTEIGNRHMLETQRSEPFLKSQRDMIRASTELRIAQGELSEFIGRHYGLPTRTELDDVHRSLTEMRREVRKMRRALDAAKPAALLQPDKLLAKARPNVTRSNSRREGR